ncbi:unnamed protein product [Linum tenue]|uniref:Disease resistance N-terminal domain-containing protein n=1 Tax=Linum tenue TaxID=586396 RepID=A0AAV0PR67_9ROSI|nr:unnamed protein product [Linum tenue]
MGCGVSSRSGVDRKVTRASGFRGKGTLQLDIRISEDGLLDVGNDEAVSVTCSGLTVLVFEAVALRSFLWNAERVPVLEWLKANYPISRSCIPFLCFACEYFSPLPNMAFVVAEAILKKLGPLAVEQVGLLWGLGREVLKLKSTVTSIQAVLLDAEEQSGLNNQVQVWLQELKQVLYDADDLLDDFNTEALLRQQQMDGSGNANLNDKAVAK